MAHGFWQASVARYYPAAGTFAATGAMVSARKYHTAALLPNGKVLSGGGYDAVPLQSAVLYR